MKNFTLLSIALFISVLGFSQAPILNWGKTYNGNEYSVDSSSVMKMYDIDKSIYIGATSDAFGTANDFLLIKRNFLTGDTLWTRRYNGTSNGDDQLVDMVINQSTGDVYITGKSQGIGSGYDIVTIKYSKDGFLLWSKRWDNGFTKGDDFPSSIGLDVSGNIYISGSTFNNDENWSHLYNDPDFDVVFFKYKPNGQRFNAQFYDEQLDCNHFKNITRYSGKGSIDIVSQMRVGNNGEFFYIGKTTASGVTYGYFGCLGYIDYFGYESSLINNTTGNNGWTFNDVMIFGSKVYALELDNSNNAYIATNSLDDKISDVNILKLRKDGELYYSLYNLLDKKSANVSVSKIKVDVSGNLYIIGTEASINGDLDWFIVKLDIQGKKVWKTNKISTINGNDYPKDLAFDNMQNPIIVGTLKTSERLDELTIIKLNKNTGSEIYANSYKKEGVSTVPFNIFVDTKNNTIINGIQKSEYTSGILTLKYSAPIADAGAISGITSVCQGEKSLTYQVPEIENAASYLWTLPNGASGNSSTNSINISFSSGATSGEIAVKGINTFGEGKSSSLAITILPQPNIIAGNDTSLCAGSSIILSAKGGNTYNWDNEIKQNVEFTPTSTKTYTVIGSNGLCQNSDEITVTVNALPVSPLIYMTDGVLNSSISGSNIWYYNDQIIKDAKLNIYTPTQSGDYYAVVSDGICESLPSNFISFIKTDIESIDNQSIIKIYPNPSIGNLKLEFNNSDKMKEISIFDSTGRLVRNTRTQNNSIEINMTNNSKGIYLLNVTLNGVSHCSKIDLK